MASFTAHERNSKNIHEHFCGCVCLGCVCAKCYYVFVVVVDIGILSFLTTNSSSHLHIYYTFHTRIILCATQHSHGFNKFDNQYEIFLFVIFAHILFSFTPLLFLFHLLCNTSIWLWQNRMYILRMNECICRSNARGS